MKYSLFILLLTFSSYAATVIAEDTVPDPQTLINEMSQAGRDLNYDGVFVYRQGNQIETMRIIHKSGDDGIYERLVSLTGHAREVIRDKDEVRCYYPDNKSVVVEKSRTGELISTYIPNPVQSISEFYNFENAGSERVAGKDAWVVNVRPKDKYRYGYQLWIDKQTSLLLKSELKNQLGITLEQIQFAQINVLDHVDESLLKPGVSANDYTWYNNATKSNNTAEINNKKWQATWMPAGFSMSEHATQAIATSAMPVKHIVYTDGLATVSIFVEKNDQQPDQYTGSVNIGGVNTYATHLDGYQITAVGEVPKATVKQMADSVKSFH